tara:strand:+ start:899 stop:2911 length:2013 start_codon:yes stop_codon:yes gene_type:complete
MTAELHGGSDLVTLNVINNRLTGVVKDMGTTMMRAAYSPIFNESLDFSCVLFDRRGRMVSQTEFSPAQVGAIRFVVKWLIAEIGEDAIGEGDVLVHNDPYRGGAHMPEHVVVKPVYFDKQLFGYVANIAHMVEVGGMAVGGFAATATEVYQEGLRVPPVWLMRGGEYVHDVWRIIMANHRAARYSWGDLHAMLASLNVAESRVSELLSEYGYEVMNSAIEQLLDYAENWMRSEIQAIPDGDYFFEDHMEDASNPPTRNMIRLTMSIQGDSVTADFTGTDPQGPHVLNCTYGVSASAIYNGIFNLVDNDIPHNDGAYRPITVISPPGSMVNVVEPGASVGGNTETHPRLWDIVMGAMAQAIPERVSAATGGTSCNFLFGGNHPDTGRMFVHYHFDGVGWGGKSDRDGNDNLCVPNGNCITTPVEVFETRYPYREWSYSLRQDSGGPGMFRGGLGTERLLEVLSDEITISALYDRMVTGPWGLFDGKPGGTSELLIKKAGTDEYVTFRKAFGTLSNSRVANVIVRRGDMLILRSSGGGGYGHPFHRDLEAVMHDVVEGYVSLEQADEAYGVIFETHGESLTLDVAKTEDRRSHVQPYSRDLYLPIPVSNVQCQFPSRRLDPDGSWRPLQRDWWDTKVEHCHFCGQMIPRDVWVTSDKHRFCSIECDSRFMRE